MPWPRCALLLCISLVAGWSRGLCQNRISFQFGGGTLSLETATFVNISYETVEKGQLNLRATSPSGQTVFMFFEKEGKVPLDWKQIITAQGIDPEGLHPLEDVTATQEGWGLHRIKSEGPYFDQIMDVRVRSNSRGSAVFLLIGEDEDFYSIYRSFTAMANRFQSLSKRNTKPGSLVVIPDMKDSFWEVVLTILLLVGNIGFIWFGFRELARTRELE